MKNAGVCQIHFTKDSFTNPTKLQQGINPMPWDMNSSLSVPQQNLGKQAPSLHDKISEAAVHLSTIEMSENIVENSNTHDLVLEKSETVSSSETSLMDNNTLGKSNIQNVQEKGNLRTYKSNQQIFFDDEDDSRMEYLHFEKEIEPIHKDPILDIITDKDILTQIQKENLRLKKRNKLNTKFQLIEKRLKHKIKILKSSLKKEKAKNKRLTEKIYILEEELHVDNYLDRNDCTDLLSRAIVKLQLHKNNTPYTDEEKTISKLIYYHSASCYARLRQTRVKLPAESTVRRWVSEFSVEPGFCENYLQLIGESLAKLPESERLCALKWDEMSIKSWEEYSKTYDMIEGLVDMGFLGRRKEKAKQVLLLCLDSINAKNPWRQLFAYFFTSGATGNEIIEIIQEGLTRAKLINALVKLVVCDQGAANRKAYNLLNVTTEKPYFMHNGEKYLASFDWPHLIKRLIYQLRTYKYIYCNKEIIVSFFDLYNTWQIDKSNCTSNLLGHISSIHFEPSSSFDSMNVKRAFQLLSQRMASAVKTAGMNELKSSTWQVSAKFVEKMNEVIDACNSRKLKSQNPLKRPLSESNPEIQKTLELFKEDVVNWRVKQNKSYVQQPCFSGLALSQRY